MTQAGATQASAAQSGATQTSATQTQSPAGRTATVGTATLRTATVRTAAEQAEAELSEAEQSVAEQSEAEQTGDLCVVLGSSGRRVYLVRWFREAMQALGLRGRVVVTDSDPHTPGAAFADQTVTMPRFDDPAYGDAMVTLADELKPQLFLSVNDFELDALSGDLGAQMRARGVHVPSIAPEAAQGILDKAQMATLLTAAGITTPTTVLASDIDAVRALAADHPRLVIKHRFGSGSSGLQIVDSSDVDEAVAASIRALGTQTLGDQHLGDQHLGEVEAGDFVVVQPCLAGDEYGLDLVGPLYGRGSAGVLARRKLQMRGGETDRAESVDPTPFAATMQRLDALLRPTGPVDIDILATSGGESAVIDINPRFGGGYAFSHLAGADMPLHYLQMISGRTVRGDCLTYTPGITAGKYIDIAITAR